MLYFNLVKGSRDSNNNQRMKSCRKRLCLGGGGVAKGPSVQFRGVPESPPPAWGPLAVHPPKARGPPWQRGSRDSAAGPALALVTPAPRGGDDRPETPDGVGVAARPLTGSPALYGCRKPAPPAAVPQTRGAAQVMRVPVLVPREPAWGAWRGRARAARRRPPRSRAPASLQTRGAVLGRRPGRPAGEPSPRRPRAGTPAAVASAEAEGGGPRSPLPAPRSPFPSRPVMVGSQAVGLGLLKERSALN